MLVLKILDLKLNDVYTQTHTHTIKHEKMKEKEKKREEGKSACKFLNK